MESFSFKNGSLHFQQYSVRDVISQLYASKSQHTVPPSNFIEEWWLYLVQNLGDLNMFVAFYSFMNVCYVLGGLIFYFVEKFHLLDQYKVQQQKFASREDYKNCIKNIVTNYVLIIYPLIYFTYPVLSLLNFEMALPLPTIMTFIWQMGFCIVVEDIAHYWIHRFLHLPWIYPTIHKVHHKFATPFGLSASYAHWAEVLLLGIPTFLGPLLLRTHYSIFFSFLLFRQLDAVVTHCGYDIPNPFDVIPYFGGTVAHDFHHKSFIYNYSSRFTFMDKLFGTYKHPPLTGREIMRQKLQKSS